MKEDKPKRRSGKLVLLIIAGVPLLVTVAGVMVGAHIMEIVIFSMLCLFSMTLVLFYGLG